MPVAAIPDDKLGEHFGFLGMIVGLDNPVSTARTQRVLRWEAVHPGLLADFDQGHYFSTAG